MNYFLPYTSAKTGLQNKCHYQTILNPSCLLISHWIKTTTLVLASKTFFILDHMYPYFTLFCMNHLLQKYNFQIIMPQIYLACVLFIPPCMSFLIKKLPSLQLNLFFKNHVKSHFFVEPFLDSSCTYLAKELITWYLIIHICLPLSLSSLFFFSFSFSLSHPPITILNSDEKESVVIPIYNFKIHKSWDG